MLYAWLDCESQTSMMLYAVKHGYNEHTLNYNDAISCENWMHWTLSFVIFFKYNPIMTNFKFANNVV